MEQKQVPPTAPGFVGGAPPAYDQHQQFSQHYPQQYQQPVPGQQQVIHVITAPTFGPDPAQIVCPSCRMPIVTKIDYESSTKTHLMAGLLCLLVWPCFWLPYIMDGCKNANHYCSNCSAYLGTYRGS